MQILDLRSADEFRQRRLRNSCNIPLSNLRANMYLLPDKQRPFTVLVPSHLPLDAAPDRYSEQITHSDVITGKYSVGAFLERGGWLHVTSVHDSERLWEREAGNTETCAPEDPAATCAKGMFVPCSLLSGWIQRIEAGLQFSVTGTSTSNASAQEATRAAASTIEPFLYLDVGCGSGRDLAWIAARSQRAAAASSAGQAIGQEEAAAAAVPAPAALAEMEPAAGAAGAAAGAKHSQHQPAGSTEPQEPQPACTAVPVTSTSTSTGASTRASTRSPSCCTWHVTGIDNWPGAIERAQQLMTSLKVHPQSVSFALARVDTETGILQDVPVPGKYKRAAGNAAVQEEEQQLCQQAEAQLQLRVAEAIGSESREHVGQEGEPPEAGLAPTALLPFGLISSAKVSGRCYHLILCSRFLERAFLSTITQLLAPGGFLLYSTFLDMPGTRAFGRPAGDNHLLKPGELARQHFGPQRGFQVLCDEVEVLHDGREVCLFVARKKACNEQEERIV